MKRLLSHFPKLNGIRSRSTRSTPAKRSPPRRRESARRDLCREFVETFHQTPGGGLSEEGKDPRLSPYWLF